MRNLKKFLALVLAMVMAFSLMVTANAQVVDWDDGDQADEAFITAIDVLSGMEIFRGDENGFRPGANITRAEVAALIYRLATGDVQDVRAGLYANYGNFVDVNESDWFAGYVGYCANAGYIRGTSDTTFSPYLPVTGYEVLAMILRAVGYDKNNEFYGPNWQTTVSATATQLGILTNVKTTHYASTLHLASRRDVVADLLFQTAAYVPMVKYSVAFGYQDTGMEGGVTGVEKNPTLGEYIFGLEEIDCGILLGNEETGEKEGKSVMGFASAAGTVPTAAELAKDPYIKGAVTRTTTGAPLNPVTWSAYTWADTYTIQNYAIYDASGTQLTTTNSDAVSIGDNRTFGLSTGIDLVGHRLDLWYDNGKGVVSGNDKRVYAYYDEADTAVVWADDTNMAKDDADADNTSLGEAINGQSDLETTGSAVFNDSFGKFGQVDTATAPATAKYPSVTGNGVAVTGDNVAKGGRYTAGFGDSNAAWASPVDAYKVIDNNGDGKVDAVIALNIESSQITESNIVNRVPTISVRVDNRGRYNNDMGATPGAVFTTAGGAQTSKTAFVADDGASTLTAHDRNVQKVTNATIVTWHGIIAQDALVGNSTKTLGDYVFGIHITGTSPRDVSTTEKAAINVGGSNNASEDAYFKMVKVEAGVTGTVVAYDVIGGTVTLDVNGVRTTIERSDWYETVVGWTDTAVADLSTDLAPNTAIPQGWIASAEQTDGHKYWVEGYANEPYTFYVDYEGKYLGAERGYNNSFLYGTYLDYEQATSTGTFKYFLTGIDLNGNQQTIPVTTRWYDNAGTYTKETIKQTNALSIPFRDSNSGGGKNNGLGKGIYKGFAVSGTTVDEIITDQNQDKNEYIVNMARLGIKAGGVTAMQYFNSDSGATGYSGGANDNLVIDTDSITLGAALMGTDVNSVSRYVTEGTTFILVSGNGTASAKGTVYNGISDLLGTAASVTLHLGDAVKNTSPGTNEIAIGDVDDTSNPLVASMTYFTDSNYTYAQNGLNDKMVNTIILPADAVTWSGGSNLYYVGDPTPVSVNSWGADAWKYNLYVDGVLQQVWLTAEPGTQFALIHDTFIELSATGKKANDGQPIYDAGSYDSTGKFTQVYLGDDNGNASGTSTGLPSANKGTNNYISGMPQLGYMVDVTYKATTRDAQTAVFTNYNSDDGLLRVSGAKVVNLNAQENCITRPQSGYVWPGITDLTTLNAAGSINPITGRALKVSAVVDSSNPLIVTTIYVCYEQ